MSDNNNLPQKKDDTGLALQKTTQLNYYCDDAQFDSGSFRGIKIRKSFRFFPS